MFDWIDDAIDLFGDSGGGDGLDMLLDSGADYVGDLPLDEGVTYVGDLPVDTGYSPEDVQAAFNAYRAGEIGNAAYNPTSSSGVLGHDVPWLTQMGFPSLGNAFNTANLGNLLSGFPSRLLDGLGGRGSAAIAMPRVETPTADKVSALAVPAMRETPAPPAFTPLQIPNAAPPRDEMDLRGLARLLRGAH